MGVDLHSASLHDLLSYDALHVPCNGFFAASFFFFFLIKLLTFS